MEGSAQLFRKLLKKFVTLKLNVYFTIFGNLGVREGGGDVSLSYPSRKGGKGVSLELRLLLG